MLEAAEADTNADRLERAIMHAPMAAVEGPAPVRSALRLGERNLKRDEQRRARRGAARS